MNFDSKELYINMGNDIPLWNDLYSYEEQDDDVKQFWENEAMKLLNGVTINGVFIHPWLYWHINFWKMMIDVGDDRIPGNSQLRDNEWMFAEFLKQDPCRVADFELHVGRIFPGNDQSPQRGCNQR